MTRNVPIGSIVASLLNYNQFAFAAAAAASEDGRSEDPLSAAIPPAPPVDPRTTPWVPADGRAVPGSGFHRLTGKPNVPDLRGLFLRGTNNFDPKWTEPPQAPEQLDPEGLRALGSFQRDSFASHAHSFQTRVPAGVPGGSGEPGHQGLAFEGGVTDPNGGSETRGKNAAVAYYVRIN